MTKYVLTYGNLDSETVTRGPFTAAEALATIADVKPHLPEWANGHVNIYVEGDFDGEQHVTENDLRRLVAVSDYVKSPEGRTVRRVCAALAEAGTPVVSVWDGEESTPTKAVADVLVLASDLDQLHLYTEGGSWVFIVNGNEWDSVSDYTVDLEAALAPVNRWTDARA